MGWEHMEKSEAGVTTTAIFVYKKRHDTIVDVIRLYHTTLDVMQIIFSVLASRMKATKNSLSKL